MTEKISQMTEGTPGALVSSTSYLEVANGVGGSPSSRRYSAGALVRGLGGESPIVRPVSALAAQSDEFYGPTMDSKWTRLKDGTLQDIETEFRFNALQLYNETPSPAGVHNQLLYSQPFDHTQPFLLRAAVTMNSVNDVGSDLLIGFMSANGTGAIYCKLLRVTAQPNASAIHIIGAAWVDQTKPWNTGGTTDYNTGDGRVAPKQLGVPGNKHVQMRWDGAGNMNWDISADGRWFYNWEGPDFNWFTDAGFAPGTFPNRIFIGCDPTDMSYPNSVHLQHVRCLLSNELNPDELLFEE